MAFWVKNQVVGKATHALVIGVGTYAQAPWGLQNLDGATASALAFVDWLQKDFPNNGAPPLATVDLLLSPTPGAPSPPGIERATTANVEAAVAGWFTRCSTSEENLAVLYFCGHGLEKGLKSALLCEDFGKHALPLDVMQEAVDLDGLSQGMEACLARNQWFIIDACRNAPPRLFTLQTTGKSIIAPDIDAQLDTPRDLAILYATANGQEAYGAPGTVSQFTGALLEALRGAAWDDRESPWNIWTLRVEHIIPAVNDLLTLQQKYGNAPRQRAQNLHRGSGMLLMRTQQSPAVPVVVLCDPVARTPQTALRVHRNGTVMDQRVAGPGDPWRISLPADASPYDVEATVQALAVKESILVRPPCRETIVRVP